MTGSSLFLWRFKMAIDEKLVSVLHDVSLTFIKELKEEQII